MWQKAQEYNILGGILFIQASGIKSLQRNYRKIISIMKQKGTVKDRHDDDDTDNTTARKVIREEILELGLTARLEVQVASLESLS